MTWMLELPDLPVHTHNGRGHWNARYGAFRDWKDTVTLMARTSRQAFPDPPVTVTLWCVQADRRRRDVDNLVAGACKPAVDGLVAAGLLEDDSWRHVREVRLRLTADPSRPVHGWWLRVEPARVDDNEVEF